MHDSQPVAPPFAQPFVREAGTGPGVVCLHANASSSAQWRALIDVLAPTCHVLAPDLYDSGKSPAWPSKRDQGRKTSASVPQRF